MSDIILHQYAASLFSEKIRLLLGFKGASYKQVEMPMIMPRPDLMPLTGGYRKTPVMQIGADIYCDTAIICRVIDDLFPDKTIYPPESQGVQNAIAHWTDTFFFRVCVAMVFSPKAIATNEVFQDQDAAAAFMADRAELSKGSTELTLPFEIAEPHFLAHLNSLDLQLQSGGRFLLGETPTIADFSTYHNCWFVHSNEALKEVFTPFECLLAWMERMAAFGHGKVEEITSGQALEIGTAAEPDEIIDGVSISGIEPGAEVEVMPIDYGFQPVRGELLTASFDEIAVARSDETAGRIVVHFPTMGFQVNTV